MKSVLTEIHSRGRGRWHRKMPQTRSRSPECSSAWPLQDGDPSILIGANFTETYFLSLSPTLALSLTITLSLSSSLFLSLSLSLSLLLSHSLPLSLSCSLSLTFSQFLSLSITLSQFLSLSLSRKEDSKHVAARSQWLGFFHHNCKLAVTFRWSISKSKRPQLKSE